MLQVGDLVCYGTTGACRVTAREARRYGDHVVDCLVLKPVFDHSMTICVPEGNAALMGRLHPPITREALLQLLHQLPPAPPPSTAPDDRRKYYADTLKSGDHQALLQMVRGIHGLKCQRRAAGKRLSGFDEAALHEAKTMLYTEFALALDIRPEEVGPFLRRELGIEE